MAAHRKICRTHDELRQHIIARAHVKQKKRTEDSLQEYGHDLCRVETTGKGKWSNRDYMGCKRCLIITQKTKPPRSRCEGVKARRWNLGLRERPAQGKAPPPAAYIKRWKTRQQLPNEAAGVRSNLWHHAGGSGGAGHGQAGHGRRRRRVEEAAQGPLHGPLARSKEAEAVTNQGAPFDMARPPDRAAREQDYATGGTRFSRKRGPSGCTPRTGT